MVLYNGTKGFVWLIIWHRSYNNFKDKTQYNGFLTNTNLRYFVYTYGTNLCHTLPTHRHDHFGLRWLHTRKLLHYLPCHIHNILCFHIGTGTNKDYRLWFCNLIILGCLFYLVPKKYLFLKASLTIENLDICQIVPTFNNIIFWKITIQVIVSNGPFKSLWCHTVF